MRYRTFDELNAEEEKDFADRVATIPSRIALTDILEKIQAAWLEDTVNKPGRQANSDTTFPIYISLSLHPTDVFTDVLLFVEWAESRFDRETYNLDINTVPTSSSLASITIRNKLTRVSAYMYFITAADGKCRLMVKEKKLRPAEYDYKYTVSCDEQET